MNFNPKQPTISPRPKKNNNKLIAEIIIAVVLSTFGAIGLIHYVMDMQNNMEHPSSGSSYQPSASEIRTRCIDTIRDLQGSEPTKLAVNICVGTVLDQLNK